MKILYVSKLEGNQWQGPTHSVPMQIKSQAKIDDVCWVNLCHSKIDSWKSLPYYHESSRGLKTGLKDIPTSFGHPDLIIFEGIYEYPFSVIAKDAQKNKIPYILVPRSSLTKDAQKKKPLKKPLKRT